MEIKEEVMEEFLMEVEDNSPPPYRPGRAKKPNFVVKLRQGKTKVSAPSSEQEPELWWDECLVGAGFLPSSTHQPRGGP